MEIKKTSSVATIIQQNNSDETEKKSEKTTAVVVSTVKDVFAVERNNNGGLFSESRSVQQAKENLGKKELSPEEEQRVSNFATTDLKKPTYFVQTSESRSNESKNSGLSAPFTRPKSPEQELKDKAAEDKKKAKDFDRGNTLGNNTSNQNVNQLVDGSNLRDTLKNEMAERHEEINAITGGTGSPKEKLTNVMGSIAPEPEKSEPTYGKGMISQSLGIDPTPAEVEAAKKAREAAEKKAAEPKAPKEPTISEKVGKALDAAKDLLVWFALTKTPVPPPPMEKDEYENFGKGIGSILKSKDRTPESEAKKGGGGLRSYDYENYKGGTPEQIKRHMDYLREQYRKAHQDPGGQQIQEDPNAVKGGAQVNDANLHVFELGNTGLVGQPDTTREPGSIGNSTQPGGASGGDIDWGPDSSQTGFNGTTHQDDSGDIQFGPSGQPEQIAEEEEEEAKNRKTRNDSIRNII